MFLQADMGSCEQVAGFEQAGCLQLGLQHTTLAIAAHGKSADIVGNIVIPLPLADCPSGNLAACNSSHCTTTGNERFRVFRANLMAHQLNRWTLPIG
jgi:hypothetical protein